MTQHLTVVDHPLVQHKLTLLRDKNTSTHDFRRLLREIGWFLGYEALKGLKLEDKAIATPVTEMVGAKLAGKKVTLIPILRAGDGLLAPFLDLLPSARVGQMGIVRDEETLMPSVYFKKYPKDIADRPVVILDPMLATAGSAIEAINEMKRTGATNIIFVCLVAAPEGVANMNKTHPDVPITAAALDEKLNEVGYIVPGLGDAGDRIFGTKGA